MSRHLHSTWKTMTSCDTEKSVYFKTSKQNGRLVPEVWWVDWEGGGGTCVAPPGTMAQQRPIPSSVGLMLFLWDSLYLSLPDSSSLFPSPHSCSSNGMGGSRGVRVLVRQNGTFSLNTKIYNNNTTILLLIDGPMYFEEQSWKKSFKVFKKSYYFKLGC